MDFFKRHRLAFLGAGLLVLVVGFLLFRPDKLFVDDRVDESLAEAFAATGDDAGAAATTTTTTITTVPETTAADEGAPASTPTTTTTTPAPEAEGPVSVTAGGFFGIDHAAEGTATVYEQDGRYVLRFEDDTDIQNGPDLYVWVLAADGYSGGVPGEFLDLGKIKGNVGGQNYELPDGFDPAVHETVLIWCLRFGVPFAAAPLTPSSS